MSKPRCKLYREDTKEILKYAHYKYDGMFLSLFNGRAFSSLETDLTKALEYLKLPTKGNFYGELFITNKSASAVKTAIAQRWDNLQFAAFASVDLPSDTPLERVEAYAIACGLKFIPYELFDARLTNYPLPYGVEGYVFKTSNLNSWYKWKPQLTMDCIVLDLSPGNGKYAGIYGSLRVGVYDAYGNLVEIADVGSGFTDDERTRLTVGDIGRVVEVGYQCIGSAGRLRHPIFKRWRDDKLARDCQLETQV